MSIDDRPLSLDDDLRRVLADERHASPGWPDATARVTAGMRRRRRRRIAAAGAVTLLVVAAAVLVVNTAVRPGAGASDVAGGGPLPWIDSPAGTPEHLARRSPRADRRPCLARDLADVAWTDGGATEQGSLTYAALLPNMSDSRCTLTGTASVLATDPVTGQRLAVETILQDGRAGADKQYPATIDPGEPARVDISVPATCSGGAARRYQDLALRVEGREIPLSGLPLPAGCPVTVGHWYVQPPLLNTPLTVSLVAPTRARRGDVIEYTVVVLNAHPRAFRLVPCPVYQQKLGGTPARTYRLNCTVKEISPHRSVKYSMRLAVPADAPLGPAKLTWMAIMNDGEVAIADLATGGATLEVVD